MSTIPNRDKKTEGFTLVETLVAIAILMIAIAGPLSIANQALTAALYARDQSIATFLAQEEMEIIKNQRDNNIKNDPSGSPSQNWLYTGGNPMSSCFGPSANNACGVSVTDSPGSVSFIQCSAGACKLTLNDYGYGYSSGGSTLFTRYFYLSAPGSNPDSPSNCVTSDECQATVVVSWNEGTVPNLITLSSELTNTLR